MLLCFNLSASWSPTSCLLGSSWCPGSGLGGSAPRLGVEVLQPPSPTPAVFQILAGVCFSRAELPLPSSWGPGPWHSLALRQPVPEAAGVTVSAGRGCRWHGGKCCKWCTLGSGDGFPLGRERPGPCPCSYAAWPAPDSVLLTLLQGSSVFHSVEDVIF